MKILVCVKQAYVPSSNILLDKDPPRIHYNTGGFKINSYDEYGIEEALRIKESASKIDEHTYVHAISVGPERVETVIKRAMEMGADEGIHIQCDASEELSPYQVAYLIASYAKDKQYDIVITGVMSDDGMYMQTGTMIAGLIGYPHISSVVLQELRKDHSLYIEAEHDGRRRQTFEVKLPCVLTVQSGINKPRYPSLSNVLRAKKQKILKIQATDIGIPEAREAIVKMFLPNIKQKGVILDGTPMEKATKLLKLLHEKSLI